MSKRDRARRVKDRGAEPEDERAAKYQWKDKFFESGRLRELSRIEAKVLWVLWDSANKKLETFPGAERVRRYVGCQSINYIHETIKRLECHGLLQNTRRRHKKYGTIIRILTLPRG